MSTKKERMYERIEQHGKNLLVIFPNAKEQDPIKLCKKLMRIETKAHRVAEEYCNGDLDFEEWECYQVGTLVNLAYLLGEGEAMKHVFINGDPRGYALKINSTYTRENNLRIYADLGGYGILAPDLSEEF